MVGINILNHLIIICHRFSGKRVNFFINNNSEIFTCCVFILLCDIVFRICNIRLFLRNNQYLQSVRKSLRGDLQCGIDVVFCCSFILSLSCCQYYFQPIFIVTMNHHTLNRVLLNMVREISISKLLYYLSRIWGRWTIE